jgi:hypothetical protein
MTALPNLYSDPNDVDQRLEAMNLTVSNLLTAAKKGLAAWADCTPNHPPTYPGTAFWAETTRALREGLFAAGWTRKNESNLPLVVNENETLAIAVSSGNEETGRKDGTPGTRSAKGPRTAAAVRVNQQQQAFDFMDPEAVIESLKTAGRATWLFLTYRDLSAQELRCELSRPISMTEDGHVDQWGERILLEPIPFGDLSLSGYPESIEQSPEIVVHIEKLA